MRLGAGWVGGASAGATLLPHSAASQHHGRLGPAVAPSVVGAAAVVVRAEAAHTREPAGPEEARQVHHCPNNRPYNNHRLRVASAAVP